MASPSSSQIRHYLSESELEDSSDDSLASAGPESDIDQAQLDAPPIVNVVAPVDIGDEETDDQEDDPVIYDPTWSLRTAGLQRIPFTKQNQLLVPAPGTNEPIDWFFLLCDDNLLEKIVSATNKNAWKILFSPNLKVKSRINNWQELTVAELKKFIGLIFHMGTVKINRLNDYWKTDRMFNFGFVRSQMSRDRFLLILRCLHFYESDEETVPDDRLYKVRLLIDYFNQKMKTIYYPCRELSIDEGMVLWRGRLHFRQYIQGKRHKYGIKIYSLCEPDGLCVRFTVYSGKGGELGGKGHASKVVKYLMRGMLGVGHSLFMDNYYISYPLASDLLSEKTYCTGTMRSDRKHVPLDLKTARLARGEKAERYANGVLIGKWCDKRQVLYLSTEFENDWAISNNRYNQPRQKPLPIVQYNAHMKGVDRNDQLMSYYAFEHKSIRWYKKIFVHFLQMLLVNSFKLYLQTNPRKRSLYHFRLSIIDMLLPAANAITPPLRPRQQTAVRHVLSKMDTPDNTGERKKRKRCRECSKTKKRTMTLFFCAQCPGEPGLCALRCFDKYHE